MRIASISLMIVFIGMYTEANKLNYLTKDIPNVFILFIAFGLFFALIQDIKEIVS